MLTALPKGYDKNPFPRQVYGLLRKTGGHPVAGFRKAPNLPDMLREQLGTSYVGTVHRLDREASGVMVYSLDPKITGKLTAAFADKENTVKEYRALLTGVPEDRRGELPRPFCTMTRKGTGHMSLTE